MTRTHQVITRTKTWLTDSVLAHNFCPYAKQPFEQGSITYNIFTGVNPVELLEILAHICIDLDKAEPTQLETSLLIVSNQDSQYTFLADFFDYLDMLDVANSFLEKPRKYIRRFSDTFQIQHFDAVPKTWADDYQLASFHPDYVFSDASTDDRENYTNRSPYPIFHVLRNISIEAVRIDADKAERIVQRNCTHLQNMDNTDFQKLVRLSHQS